MSVKVSFKIFGEDYAVVITLFHKNVKGAAYYNIMGYDLHGLFIATYDTAKRRVL